MGRRKKKNRNADRGKGPQRGSPFGTKTNRDSADRLRPWLLGAMTALLVARLLYPSESVANEGDGLPLVMLWIALAVFWALGLIGRTEFRLRFGWVDVAVAALIAWHTLASIWAANYASPRPAINMLWEWIGMGIAFFLARQLVVGARETRAIIVVMIALAVGLSGYGLYQYRYEMPQKLAWYDENPDKALRDAGIWYEPGSPDRKRFRDRLASPEPYATFGGLANSLAGYLAPWLVVGAGIVIGSSVGRIRFVVCLIPIGVCLLLTKSRTACLAVAVTALGVALVWLFFRGGMKRIGWKLPAAVAGLGAVLVVVVLAAGGLNSNRFAGAAKSLEYRLEYWQSTSKMIAEKPWFGCGPGNFQYQYTQYKLPQASEEVADPHNFLFEVCATAGVPALVALLVVLGGFAWVSWRLLFPESGSDGVSPTHGQATRGDPASFTGDEPNYVYGGAICGFLLAMPLGQISAGTPSAAAVPLVFVLATVCLGLLRTWVDRGPLPNSLPAIGIAVLLVNLLAAGGIGYPAVAGTFWLLLALGLNAAYGMQTRIVPRGVALCGVILSVTLAVACYLSGYGPVLRCRGSMPTAEQDRSMVVELLAKAAVEDPLDARPWQQLAALILRDWQVAPDAKKLSHFETCCRTTLQLTPHSSYAHRIAGDWYLEIFNITSEPEHINKAVDYYRRAVYLYPNSGLCRARLALAFHESGRLDAFFPEAEKALWLDDVTPHGDQKLPPGVREQIEELCEEQLRK